MGERRALAISFPDYTPDRIIEPSAVMVRERGKKGGSSVWVHTHPLDLRGRIGLSRPEEGLTCRIPIPHLCIFVSHARGSRGGSLKMFLNSIPKP